MVRKLVWDVFEDSFTLADTQPYQHYKHSQAMCGLVIYVSTQNCYVGRQGKQDFLLAASASFDDRYALKFLNVDLADLHFKAAVAGSVVHLVGTMAEEEKEKAEVAEAQT
jgi:hypothetical protein